MSPETTAPPASPYFTIKETAAYLKVSTKSVRRYIAAGHLEAHRYGGAWRLPLAQFETPGTAAK